MRKLEMWKQEYTSQYPKFWASVEQLSDKAKAEFEKCFSYEEMMIDESVYLGTERRSNIFFPNLKAEAAAVGLKVRLWGDK